MYYIFLQYLPTVVFWMLISHKRVKENRRRTHQLLTCHLCFYLFIYRDGVLLCCPGWSAMARSRLTATSAFWAQVISCLSLLRITGANHHALLLFVFLVETRFCHFGQAGLELLASSDPHALASQSVGITGVSHHI